MLRWRGRSPPATPVAWSRRSRHPAYGSRGAGFPTGLKWSDWPISRMETESSSSAMRTKGIPVLHGSQSSRRESHSIIEGCSLVPMDRGNKGIIYVRNEYPLAIKHLLIALRQASQLGLLGSISGNRIFLRYQDRERSRCVLSAGKKRPDQINRGKDGEPRQRPPFPSRRDPGSTTSINNVETGPIFRSSSAWAQDSQR